MKKVKLLNCVLFLALLALPMALRADVNIDLGYRDSVTFFWESYIDDSFSIIDADTNQEVASVSFLNNGYGPNMVSGGSNWGSVSVSVSCDQSPWAFTGSAEITGLPPGHYILVSHRWYDDAHESVWYY